MDPATIRQMFSFAREEVDLLSGFDLPAEAFIPLLLSIRSGGDWSYAAEGIRSVSVVEKTTFYDEEKKEGRTREAIYLIVVPEILEQEGDVQRLEKCGEETDRLLVVRPYRVTVRGERIVLADVDPRTMIIGVRELSGKEVTFTGSSAYGLAHEMEHLSGGRITGTGIHAFTYERRS
jgi:predicted metalloprotease